MLGFALQGIVLAAVLAGGTATAAPISQISLQRTACFGTCPVYTVTISRSLAVVFNGQNFVQYPGKSTATITATDWAVLVSAVKEIDFSSLKNSYAEKSDGCTSLWTDNPWLIIGVTRGSEQKTVRYYLGCRGPKVLKEISWLGHRIDTIASTERWIGTGRAPAPPTTHPSGRP